MVRIIDGRASGKTNKLMLLAQENNAIIVCGNPYAMEQKARAYGITGIDFISYAEFVNRSYPEDKRIFIDELERFALLFGNVSGYTLSNED